MEKAEKKVKRIKGITLVALVVTIVVLLILAGITIASLFGDNGVINKAQKAKDETDRTAIEEQKGLNKTEEDMANAIKGNTSQGNGWTQPDPLKPEITNGEITLKIGDYVDYDCTTSYATYTSKREKNGYTEQTFKANEYEYGWRVLGVDKETKQLQLISEDFVQPSIGGVTLGVRKLYKLKGQDGYVNGVDELNKICSIYGTGEGAINARVVNADDVNRITGYNPNNIGVRDPNKTGSGKKCYSGGVYEYGNTVEYKLLTTGVQYTSKGNSATGGINTYNNKFTYYDEESKTWKSLATNESVTLKNNVYLYYPTTLTEINDINVTTGISNTSAEYKMLFTNSSTGADKANSGNTTNFYCWLGSTFVYTHDGRVDFGIQAISSGNVNYAGGLYGSVGFVGDRNYGVRPVINLDSKVTLKDSGTMKDGCKLYNMSLNK